MKKYIDRAKAISARVMAVQAAIVLTVVYALCAPFLWFIFLRKFQSQRATGWGLWNIPSETVEDLRGQ